MKKRLASYKHSFLWPALFLAAALPFLDYTKQDIVISYPSELWLLIGISVAVCALFAGLYRLALSTRWGRLLATIAALIALMQHFPRLQIWFDAPVKSWASAAQAVFVTAITLAAIWAVARTVELVWNKWIKNESIPTTILTFICLTIFALNFFTLVKYLARNYKDSSYKPKNTASQVQLSKQDDRDIYYFVFDRYASNTSLKNYFDFDNSAFLDSLRAEGFVVRDDATANYQYTAPSVASTVRMDYHTDLGSDLSGAGPLNSLPYENIIRNSPTSELLKSQGYNIYNYGNWWNVTRQGYQSTNVLPQFEVNILGRKTIISEMQTYSIERSFLQGIFGPGLKIGQHMIAQINFAQQPEIFLQQTAAIKKAASEQHDKPRFVFAHLLVPHPPYVFNADGSTPTHNVDDNNNDVPRSEKYLGFLQYGNTVLGDMLKSIITNAKKPPIIIIQADEGPYPTTNVASWPTADPDILKLKLGTLAAYYLPPAGSDQPPQAQTTSSLSPINSSVNIFRYVFDNYFGANLPLLPDCSFVYNNDKPFDYYDITQVLHAESPDCQQIAGQQH